MYILIFVCRKRK